MPRYFAGGARRHRLVAKDQRANRYFIENSPAAALGRRGIMVSSNPNPIPRSGKIKKNFSLSVCQSDRSVVVMKTVTEVYDALRVMTINYFCQSIERCAAVVGWEQSTACCVCGSLFKMQIGDNDGLHCVPYKGAGKIRD